MDGVAAETLFKTILPYERIHSAARRLGVVKRDRYLDPMTLVLSLVLNGGTAEAGRIAAALRDYVDRGGREVARSSSYKWFDTEFLRLMEELVADAQTHVLAMPHSLPGVLAGRTDWRSFDSTTVKLPRASVETFSGTGDYAALKVHVEMSLGTENVVAWHITEARRHDGPELTVDESRAGTGLLVDLGYASHDLVRRCNQHDVHFVIRLKNGWKTFLDDRVFVRDVEQWKLPDEYLKTFGHSALPATLEAEMDVDVSLGDPSSGPRARLVNIKTPEGWRAYLTNVPRDTHDGPAISFLYALRWGIELQNKLAKTCCDLDEIYVSRKISAEILVHAAMLASLIANALAHLEHIDQGYVKQRTVKPTGKRPPVHAMLMWKAVRTAAPRLVRLITGDPEEKRTWQQVANYFTHVAKDANWRSKPSPMDDAKGRNAAGRPLRKHRAKRPRPKRSPR